MSAPRPAVGWYADPAVPGQLRWWDGTRWTDDVQTAPPPGSGPAAPGRRTDGFAIASLVLGVLGGTILSIAIDDFESAADDHDGARVCSLFSVRFRANIAAGAGKRCPEAILEGNEGKRQAHLDVKSIMVTGNRAIARLKEGGDPELWRLLREGRWKIDEISRGG